MTDTPEFHKFPLWLNHPQERPAVVSDDYEGSESRGPKPPIGHKAMPGTAPFMPPVKVHNEDQLEYHLSRGYVAAPGNREAALSAIIAPKPPNYTRHEYPRVDGAGRVEADPHAPPPPDLRYPKWVRRPGFEDVMVQSEAAEIELLAATPEPPEPLDRSDIEDAAGDTPPPAETAPRRASHTRTETAATPTSRRGRGRPPGAKNKTPRVRVSAPRDDKPQAAAE